MTSASIPAEDSVFAIATRVARRRKLANWSFIAGCFLALALVVVPTAWMVGGVIAKALPHWRWSVLTTTSSGLSGGLENAVIGTVALVVGVLVVAGGIGILTGMYLAEFAGGRHRSILRGAYEILAGIPSIVLGYVGYIALVVHFHWGFSLLAGVIVLSVLVIPYIAKATESSLSQVPTAYREGADALGIPTGWAFRRIVVKAALPGIITGLLIAVAIAVGETAPLLYTAGWSDQLPSAHLLHSPVAYLTYPVWTFYNQPSNSAQQLSYDAALLLMVFVLVLIGLGRIIAWRSRRHAQ